MDNWEKLSETSLPQKEDFYIHLNLKVNIDTDNAHTKIILKNSEINAWGGYHYLSVQSDTLLFVDVFASFRNVVSRNI